LSKEALDEAERFIASFVERSPLPLVPLPLPSTTHRSASARLLAMSDDAAAEERRAKAAARQAKLLAKSKERLDRIQGAAKGEGRVVSDCASSSSL